LSGSNKAVAYFDVNSTTDDAFRVAAVSFKLVQSIIRSAPSGHAVLPLGYGVNVNIPPLFDNYTAVPIIQTRMTGGAEVDEAIPGKTPGTFTWANLSPHALGVNRCLNGDCSLPGETDVVAQGKISLSLYTVDYTAPATPETKSVMQRFAFFTGGKHGHGGKRGLRPWRA